MTLNHALVGAMTLMIFSGCRGPCLLIACLNTVFVEVSDSAGRHLTSYSGTYASGETTMVVACGSVDAGVPPDAGTAAPSDFVTCEDDGFRLIVEPSKLAHIALHSGELGYEGDTPITLTSAFLGPASCNNLCTSGRGAVTLE